MAYSDREHDNAMRWLAADIQAETASKEDVSERPPGDRIVDLIARCDRAAAEAMDVRTTLASRLDHSVRHFGGGGCCAATRISYGPGGLTIGADVVSHDEGRRLRDYLALVYGTGGSGASGARPRGACSATDCYELVERMGDRLCAAMRGAAARGLTQDDVASFRRAARAVVEDVLDHAGVLHVEPPLVRLGPGGDFVLNIPSTDTRTEE